MMFERNYTAFKDRTPVLNEREEAALQRWIKRHPEAVEPVSTRWMILPLALCAWGVVGGAAYAVFELVN